MLRTIYDDQRSTGSRSDGRFERDLNELTQFVRAGRLHQVSSCSSSSQSPFSPKRQLANTVSPHPPNSVRIPSSIFLSFPSLPDPTLQELLIRYNPLQGLSTQDRVTATANRVGLSSPTGYVKGQEFGRGWALKDGSERGDGEGGGGEGGR